MVRKWSVIGRSTSLFDREKSMVRKWSDMVSKKTSVLVRK